RRIIWTPTMARRERSMYAAWRRRNAPDADEQSRQQRPGPPARGGSVVWAHRQWAKKSQAGGGLARGPPHAQEADYGKASVRAFRALAQTAGARSVFQALKLP